MATASATYPHSHTDEFLWRLVTATACDTKDVASELPITSPSILDEVRSGFSAFASVWTLRGQFRRLARRQGKLVLRFKSAQPETWPQTDCGEMAQLLDELIHDENSVLSSAFDSPKVVLSLWKTSLDLLRCQTDELKAICLRMDALSVFETEMPGDESYREFMSLLRTPEEYDFSTDDDPRKVHSHT